jgi:hypothetical protein
MDQLSLFCERLPHRPYCTDDLAGGLLIRGREQALRYRYLQPNPPCLLIWLVFDIDRPGALLAWQDSHLAAPHLGVENPENHHGHLLYGVEVPVCTSDAARQGPLRLAAALQAAYTAQLGADHHYAGLICKNPCHPHWRTVAWADALYSLGYLAEFVDLTRYTPRPGQVKGDREGLWRNCTLFARLGPEGKWAYREIRRYWDATYTAWEGRVLDKALEWNGEFRDPLAPNEVGHLAKSVAKFCWDTLSPDSFRAFQAAQGRKGGQASAQARRASQGELFETHMGELGRRSGEARRVAAADRRDLARELRAQGKTCREIAQELGVDPATISRWTR